MFHLFVLIILLFSSLASFAQTSTTDSSVLSVTISANETASADGLPIIFTLTNSSSQPVRVLKWGTPFDNGFNYDMFEVWQGDTQISYTGRLVNRGEPKAQDFITLEANETITQELNVADGYAVYDAGDYTISFNSMLTIVKTDEELTSVNTASISSDRTYLINLKSSATISRLHIDRFELRAKIDPEFSSCTALQRNSLDEALTLAETIAEESANALASTPEQQRSNADRYIHWFGAYDVTRYDTVTSNFNRIHDVFANQQVTFDCTCNPVEPGLDIDSLVAFVFKSQPYRIHLCELFWTYDNTISQRSKPGILLHETSHFNLVASTGDFVYRRRDAESLAINQPEIVIHNADSYHLFAVNLPALAMGNPIVEPTPDPNTTELNINQPITAQIAESSWLYYKVTGATKITLSNMTKDFDLYVKLDGIPLLDDYDCKSENYVGTDACDISSNSTVFVGVKSYPFSDPTTNGGSGTFTLLAEGTSSSVPLPVIFEPFPPLIPQVFTPKPGLWWSPQKQDGNGFDIHVNGDQLTFTWYTYDEAGNPVWYLGDGHFLNNQGSGTLRRYSISNGSGLFIGTLESREVGAIQVNLNDSTHGTITWSLNGQTGSQTIEYFSVSNQSSVVDHTGLWYDPDNSGYGITVHEQGSTIVTVVYYYSFFGNPLWALGDNSNNYRLSSYKGACPYCTPTQSTFNANVGEIAINFLSKKEGLFSSSFDPIGQFFNFSDVWFINNTRIVNLTP